jgi:hypothetical protein
LSLDLFKVIGAYVEGNSENGMGPGRIDVKVVGGKFSFLFSLIEVTQGALKGFCAELFEVAKIKAVVIG